MSDDREITAEDIARIPTVHDRWNLLRSRIAPPPFPPAPVVSAGMPADHIPGAWPIATSAGRVCACSACTALAENRPPLAELLSMPVEQLPPPTQHIDQESA